MLNRVFSSMLFHLFKTLKLFIYIYLYIYIYNDFVCYLIIKFKKLKQFIKNIINIIFFTNIKMIKFIFNKKQLLLNKFNTCKPY